MNSEPSYEAVNGELEELAVPFPDRCNTPKGFYLAVYSGLHDEKLEKALNILHRGGADRKAKFLEIKDAPSLRKFIFSKYGDIGRVKYVKAFLKQIFSKLKGIELGVLIGFLDLLFENQDIDKLREECGNRVNVLIPDIRDVNILSCNGKNKGVNKEELIALVTVSDNPLEELIDEEVLDELSGKDIIFLLTNDKVLEKLSGEDIISLLTNDRVLEKLSGEDRIFLLTNEKILNKLFGRYTVYKLTNERVGKVLEGLSGEDRVFLLTNEKFLDKLLGCHIEYILTNEKFLDELSGKDIIFLLTNDKVLEKLSGEDILSLLTNEKVLNKLDGLGVKDILTNEKVLDKLDIFEKKCIDDELIRLRGAKKTSSGGIMYLV